MQAFQVPTRRQTERRLEGCPILRAGKNGMKVYDFATACAYMVKPKVSIKQYVETLDAKDLPRHLQKEFWAAKLAEQRWRKQAGELWASEDVIAVFGEMFKLIKSKSQLWGDSIEKVGVLSDPQREKLRDLVDDLTGQIFEALANLESGQSTPSQIAEVDDDDIEEAE